MSVVDKSWKLQNNKHVARNGFATSLACIFFTGAVLANNDNNTTGADWTEVTTTADGVTLSTREVAGSPYLAVKASMLINASNEAVAQAFGDGDGCAQWRLRCKSSEVLNVASEQERTVHLVLDMPWPVSDRDLVMHTLQTVDAETNSLKVELTPAAESPPTKKYIRASGTGYYFMRPVSHDQIEFTYEIHTDLGGDLSPKMINGRIAESTLEDMQALKKLAENQS